jgi:hypothetical protein
MFSNIFVYNIELTVFKRYLGAGTAQSVQCPGYELGNRRIVMRLPAGVRHFSLLQSVRTGSGADTALLFNEYPEIFPGNKAAEAWN